MSNYCEHAWVPGKFTLIQTNFDPGERPALATGEMMLCSKCAEPELRQLKASHESQAREIPDLILRNRALQARTAEMQELLSRWMGWSLQINDYQGQHFPVEALQDQQKLELDTEAFLTDKEPRG